MTASASALLVLDMQVDFAATDGVYERLGGLSGAAIRALVPRQARLMSAAREARIPVLGSRYTIFVDPAGRPLGLGHLAQLRPFLLKSGFRRETPGHALLEGLPEPDISFEKTRFSAFLGTPLESMLRELGVLELVLCGIATNGAVEGTARDAVMRDFEVTVIEDCCTAYRSENHEASLVSLRSIGSVIRSPEWLARLSARP